MADERARDTAEEERARREHEAEARKRDSHERDDPQGDDAAENPAPPANTQTGTNTGS